jgi:glycosyltransferase 2 family protein
VLDREPPATVTAVYPLDPPPVLAEPTDDTPGSVRRRSLTRTIVSYVMVALVGFFAITHLSQAEAAGGALAHADPWWIAVAAGAAALTYVFAASILRAATVLHLPLGRTIAAQLAAASANRVSPAGLGGMGVNIRYLETSGTTRTAALGAVGLGSASGFAVHLTMILGLASIASRSPVAAPSGLPAWPEIVVVLVGATVAAAGIWRWRLHRPLVVGLRSVRDHAREILAEPKRVAVLLVASAGISVANAAALAACVAAVGGHLGLTDALLIYLAGSAVGAVAPSPAGVGAVEAALIMGVGRLGVAPGVAVAGVLSYRLITYWLPVLPGLVCAASLRRRRAI